MGGRKRRVRGRKTTSVEYVHIICAISLKETLSHLFGKEASSLALSSQNRAFKNLFVPLKNVLQLCVYVHGAVGGLCTWVWVLSVHMNGVAGGSQKRVLDPLQLDLQAVVILLCGCWEPNSPHFKKKLYLFYVCVYVNAFMYTTRVQVPKQSRRGHWTALGIELQVVVSHQT